MRFCYRLKGAAVVGGQRVGHDDASVLIAADGATVHLLGKRIDMKFTPSLKFLVDKSFAEARRIDELLARPEVKRDLGEHNE